MANGNRVLSEIMGVLKHKLDDQVDEYLFPPPVFTAMEGEFLHVDLEAGKLSAQFPVHERYLNPYHAMQGGMIAAAIDNTLGPLSVLVAPPNVTRRLEIIYSRPVTLELEFVIVQARLVGRDGRFLTFKADVRDRDSQRLARAEAEHFIVDSG